MRIPTVILAGGPVAQGLATTVPDLTAVSRRYGEFPTTVVRDTIDGRGARIDAHGTGTMPVWGYELWIDEGGDVVAQGEMPKLVDCVRSIQEPLLAANRD